MRKIKVDTVKDGQELKQDELLYDIDELEILTKLFSCKDSKHRGISYLEIPCAFDIETTNIYKKDPDGNICKEPRPFAYMYHWQFCLDDQVCFGRTWEEFRHLINRLSTKMDLDYKHRLVVWCHNLNFEFMFMNRFLHIREGFYKEPYKPLKILTYEGIEFRDSYALSNMSLGKFCENERNVIHYKLEDKYDHEKVRTSKTKLTELEEAYCYNDVRGLCECIRSRMQDDTLASMPMTSTGYVRRDCRNAMRKNPKNRKNFMENKLDEKLYMMCREAFRGGNTHANLRHANQILNRVKSRDIRSSYPTWMMIKSYPIGKFFPITVDTMETWDQIGDYALIFRIGLTDVKYKGDCGMPYIPRSKCLTCANDAIIDNGRILKSAYLTMTITHIDWGIIKHDYDFKEVYFKDIYASKLGLLPVEFRNVVRQYFEGKTGLKGIDSKIYEYGKAKNKLNALFGMQCQKIDMVSTTFDGSEYHTAKVINSFTPKFKAEEGQEYVMLSRLLDSYYKNRNNFLQYSQGIFVTAWARYELQTMLWKIGKDAVYVDTDSIKYIGDHDQDFEERNKEIIAEAEKYGAWAYDKNGIKMHMGVWEDEGEYEDSGFITLGSKKYAYRKKDKEGIIRTHSVISGVDKKVGAAYFEERGLEAFEIGAKITDSGHLTAYYNNEDIHTITIQGVEMETASNVALVNNSYTLGVTGSYMELLQNALDNIVQMEYI